MRKKNKHIREKQYYDNITSSPNQVVLYNNIIVRTCIKTPVETPTEAIAPSIPRRCGCDTSQVYTLAGAPTIPEPKPINNLPGNKTTVLTEYKY